MIIKNRLRAIQPVSMDINSFPVLVTNVGISSKEDDFSVELEKANVAIAAGANIISDLSLVSDPADYQKRYMDQIEVPFSNVAVYETFCNGLSSMQTPDPEQYIRDFEEQVKRGIDLITLHATVWKGDLQLLRDSKRLIPTTSRGGAMVLRNMYEGDYENPYYVYFDDILDIARRYDVCLSLGPMYRPASVWDCHYENSLHILELERMGQLVARAKAKGVGVAVEGIGHASIGDIPGLIGKAKECCGDAPYRVLTVSTDTAMGFDHISSAIASAVAVQNGASSITCVTRSEHMGLPTTDDIREAVYSAKIAAESGFRARTGSFSNDYLVSSARKERGCFAQSEGFLFQAELSKIEKGEHKGKSCGMCGDFCPFLVLDLDDGE